MTTTAELTITPVDASTTCADAPTDDLIDTLCGHHSTDPTLTDCGDAVCGDCHELHLADCATCAIEAARCLD